MAFYQFKREQFIQATLEDVWDFIASPANLKKITPPSMGFDITSGAQPAKMFSGMIIRYRVRPLCRIPTTWVTEITHIQEPNYFIDEQRIGPYSMWHHMHRLEPCEGGVMMMDEISYQPPFGFLGAIANLLFISAQLNKIFDYREQVIEQIFNPSAKVET